MFSDRWDISAGGLQSLSVMVHHKATVGDERNLACRDAAILCVLGGLLEEGVPLDDAIKAAVKLSFKAGRTSNGFLDFPNGLTLILRNSRLSLLENWLVCRGAMAGLVWPGTSPEEVKNMIKQREEEFPAAIRILVACDDPGFATRFTAGDSLAVALRAVENAVGCERVEVQVGDARCFFWMHEEGEGLFLKDVSGGKRGSEKAGAYQLVVSRSDDGSPAGGGERVDFTVEEENPVDEGFMELARRGGGMKSGRTVRIERADGEGPPKIYRY